MNLGPNVSCGVFTATKIGSVENRVHRVLTTALEADVILLAGLDLQNTLSSLVYTVATDAVAGLSDTNFTAALRTKLNNIDETSGVTAAWVPEQDPNYLAASSLTSLNTAVGLNTAKVTYPGAPTWSEVTGKPDLQLSLVAPVVTAPSGSGNLTISGTQLTYSPPNLSNYATFESPTFTGNVSLPATTTIGVVSSLEVSHISGVTGPIQSQFNSVNSQLGNKQLALDQPVTSSTPSGLGGVAISSSTGFNTLLTYTPPDLSAFAPTDTPTLTGIVTLPYETRIGGTTAVELSRLVGVTNNVQQQLNSLTTQLGNKQIALDPPVTATPSGTGSLTLSSNTAFNSLLTFIPPDLSTKADLISPSFVSPITVSDATGWGGAIRFITFPSFAASLKIYPGLHQPGSRK